MNISRAVLFGGLAAILGLACTNEEGPSPSDGGLYGSCRQEGEQINTKVEGGTCCAGLERIAGTEQRDGGACVPVPPDLQICARCGNGTCGPGESPCNCPQDCH